MKKKITMTMLMATLVIALAGCGKNDKNDSDKTSVITENNTENNASDNKEPAVAALAENILNGGSFSDKLEQMDKSIVLTRLYNLDETKIEDAAFYTSAGATSEEVAVIKVKDSDYVEAVIAACYTRKAEQTAAFKDYVPEELPKLEAAVIYTNGNYIVMCVSCDSDKAASFIEEQFK